MVSAADQSGAGRARWLHGVAVVFVLIAKGAPGKQGIVMLIRSMFG